MRPLHCGRAGQASFAKAGFRSVGGHVFGGQKGSGFEDPRLISDPVYPVDEEADASSFQDAAEGLVGFATLDEHELEFLRFISSAPDYRGPRVPTAEEIAEFRRHRLLRELKSKDCLH